MGKCVKFMKNNGELILAITQQNWIDYVHVRPFTFLIKVFVWEQRRKNSLIKLKALIMCNKELALWNCLRERVSNRIKFFRSFREKLSEIWIRYAEIAKNKKKPYILYLYWWTKKSSLSIPFIYCENTCGFFFKKSRPHSNYRKHWVWNEWFKTHVFTLCAWFF